MSVRLSLTRFLCAVGPRQAREQSVSPVGLCGPQVHAAGVFTQRTCTSRRAVAHCSLRRVETELQVVMSALVEGWWRLDGFRGDTSGW